MRTVFVTVGTTKFNALLTSVTSDEILKKLAEFGYTDVVIQYGSGDKPVWQSDHGLNITCFQYRPSIHEVICESDLVISHAGSGTVLETLSAGTPLITVINQQLMDNHQIELAHRMYMDGYLLYSTCDDLSSQITNIQTVKLTPYVKGDPKKFSDFLDRLFGLN